LRNGATHSALQFDASNRITQAVSANKKALYSYNGFGGRVGRSVTDLSGNMLDDTYYCVDMTKPYNDLLQQRNNAGVSNFYFDSTLTSVMGA
jgi:hypothetical protein